MADDVLIDRLDLTIDLLLARRDATAALTDPELAPLAVLAAELRHVPSTAFRDRLRAHLTWRTTMTTTLVLEAKNIREGFTTVTPYIRLREAGLLDFLTAVFDAKETVSTGGAGGVHREGRI